MNCKSNVPGRVKEDGGNDEEINAKSVRDQPVNNKDEREKDKKCICDKKHNLKYLFFPGIKAQ